MIQSYGALTGLIWLILRNRKMFCIFCVREGLFAICICFLYRGKYAISLLLHFLHQLIASIWSAEIKEKIEGCSLLLKGECYSQSICTLFWTPFY